MSRKFIVIALVLFFLGTCRVSLAGGKKASGMEKVARKSEQMIELPEKKVKSWKTSIFEVPLKHLMIKQKKGYVYVLFDMFPAKESLSDIEVDKIAGIIMNELVLARFENTKKVKMDIVEYTDKDDYGSPDKVVIKAKFVISVSDGKLSFEKKKLGRHKK